MLTSFIPVCWRYLAAGLLFAATTGAALGQGFAPVVTYTTGTSLPTNAVAVGDINLDGFPDIIAADYYNMTVRVFRNLGTGAFAPAVAYPTSNSGRANDVALGNVNADNYPDIIVGGVTSGGLLLNQGNGTFGTDIAFTAGLASIYSIAMADVNGDGFEDLVTASSAVGVLLNNHNGTFAPVTTYPSASGNPNSVAVGDVNSDGRADIIVTVALTTGGNVGVLLNRGTGTFSPMVLYTTGNNQPGSVALGDVNQDGRLDVVTGHSLSNTVGVMRNSGGGVFDPIVTYTGHSQVGAVTLGDVNNDGFADIIAANYGSNTVGVRLNSGTGNFPTTTAYATGSRPETVVLSDVNRNGALDIVVAKNGSVGVLLNRIALATNPGVAQQQGRVALYPNPARAGSTTTRLELADLSTEVHAIEVTVLDAIGRVVSQMAYPIHQAAASIDMPFRSLPTGLYLLRLSAHNEQGLPVGTLPAQRLKVQ